MNSKYSIRFSVFYLSVMCLTLIASPYIPQRINNIIKLVFEIIILIGIAFMKISKNSIIRVLPTFIFFLSMCYCTYHSVGLGSRFMNSIVTGGSYFLFFLTISIFGIEYVGKIVKKNLFFYMIILDFFVIITWGNGLGGLDEAVYLIGNKFMVAYIHMFIMAFINNEYVNEKAGKQIIRTLGFFIYSCIICMIADTTTGIVGLVCVFTLSILSRKNKVLLNIMRRPMVMLAFFVGINVLFLLTDVFVNNSIIAGFFYSRSHTRSMLSGRLVMYKISMDAIAQHPVLGYGINYDIVKKTLSFGNSQNGILKMLLDYGVVGTICFSMTLFTTFQNAVGENNLKLKNNCIIFIYAMMICSLVEINLAGIFMLISSLLNSSEAYKKDY